MQDRWADHVVALEKVTRVLVATAHESAQAAPGGMSFAQVRLLLVLDGLGCVPSSRLARELGVNASTVTRLADRLEEQGHVLRGKDERRRTVVTVELTGAGRRIVKSVMRQRYAALTELTSTLSEAQREAALVLADGLLGVPA